MGELIDCSARESGGDLTFKIDDKIYYMEYKKEFETIVSEDEVDEFWELSLECEPNKKVHITPNTIPYWSYEGLLEMRVTGMLATEELNEFLRVFIGFLDSEYSRPAWVSEVADVLHDFSYYVILPETHGGWVSNEE